ncbi:MAG TPA: sugar phosphate isomerase/epimerase [Candidatus Paceibacterota bacterium]|nr:sugar phosphate isomerase/epimerase [Verrucomicrobiota bacterium]HRY47045.1 sugar phosphate isomerase/epimerase [Candidatus Paceibacterota bacterium]
MIRQFWVLWLAAVAGVAVDVSATEAPRSFPFFALCMDTHDSRKRSLSEQAALLKELGYDGAGHLWIDNLPERIQTLDSCGLRLFQVYVRMDIAENAAQPYDPRLKDTLPLLKGRHTQLALIISGGKPSDESRDPRVVQLLREIADLARPCGVSIALYPHVGDWLERVEDAWRIAQKTDLENVGLMFNLCHWLRAEESRDYATLLKRVRSRLVAVTINGADVRDDQPGWARYLQPLDRGTFDQRAFLRALHEIGYRGPVGLQCYGLEGDARDHLSRSITAWRRLN